MRPHQFLTLAVCAVLIGAAILAAPDAVYAVATGGPKWPAIALLLACFIATKIAEIVQTQRQGRE